MAHPYQELPPLPPQQQPPLPPLPMPPPPPHAASALAAPPLRARGVLRAFASLCQPATCQLLKKPWRQSPGVPEVGEAVEVHSTR